MTAWARPAWAAPPRSRRARQRCPRAAGRRGPSEVAPCVTARGARLSYDTPGLAHFLWHFTQLAVSASANAVLPSAGALPVWQAPPCSPALLFSLLKGPLPPLFLFQTFTVAG